MAARRVVDIVRFVAYALAVGLVVGVRGLAAVRGIAFADAGYLHLAFGDAMRQVQVFAVAVGHPPNSGSPCGRYIEHFTRPSSKRSN